MQPYPPGGSLLVLGLGPIGDMCTRVARHRGVEKILAVDLVPERLMRTRSNGIEVFDLNEVEELGDAIRTSTGGRGPDSVIDAVGMEAHGSPVAKMAHQVSGMLPNALAAKLMQRAGVDRLAGLLTAIDLVRRGGTISLAGVYGGAADPLPMLQMFDKQIQIRMGQANVRHWIDEIMPLLIEGDRLGVDAFATHHMPLTDSTDAYAMFQQKSDGAVKILLNP